MKVTKLINECNKRLETLHKKHYIWLLQTSKNISKSTENAEDLIGDLYLYLSEKCNPKIWYKDSFNLMYCHRFLQTRWINKKQKGKRMKTEDDMMKFDREDDVYPIEQDDEIMRAFEEVHEELERLSQTRMWPKAQLFKLYHMSDDTMIDVAKKIGISKSTTFISIKRIREHLKNNIRSPFKGDSDE